ncbi:MAG: hypothetical protein AB7N76_35790 [Planctomycetota bacterium]
MRLTLALGSCSSLLVLGLLAAGCGSSGGGGGSSTAAAVASGTSAPTASGATASTTTRATTQAPAQAPPSGTTTSPTTTPTTQTTVPPTAEPRYYNPHVRQVLYTYCTSCHSNTADPAYNAYPLNGYPVDDVSFQNTVMRGDVNDPEGSLLLKKATGAVSHAGGAVLETSDPGYEWLLNWVRQGMVKDQYSTGPKTYVRNIEPILSSQCFGCHSNGTGGYTVGSNLNTNYQELLSVTDTADPTNSLILRKNDGRLSHAGGAGWRAGTPERDLLLQWIADGRIYTR